MRVGFFDAVDRMDFGNHDIRERSFICDVDEDENVGLAEAGVRLLHSRDILQRLQDRLRFSSLDFDQDIGFRGHAFLLQQGYAKASVSERRAGHVPTARGVDLMHVVASRTKLAACPLE